LDPPRAYLFLVQCLLANRQKPKSFVMQAEHFESRLCQIMGEHEEALRRLLADVHVGLCSNTGCESSGNLGTTCFGLSEDEPNAVMHSSKMTPMLTPTVTPKNLSRQSAAVDDDDRSRTQDALPLDSLISTCDENLQIGAQPVSQEQPSASNGEEIRIELIAQGKLSDAHDADNLHCNRRSTLQSVDLFPSENKLHTFIRENNKFGRLAAHFEPLHRALSAWDNLEEPIRVGYLADFVQSMKFETFIFAVIFANCAYTVVTTNWEMAHINEKEPLAMRLVGVCFLSIYTVELIFKLVVHRQFFFCSNDAAWNIFDLSLVVNDMIDNILFLYNHQG